MQDYIEVKFGVSDVVLTKLGNVCLATLWKSLQETCLCLAVSRQCDY